MYNVILVNRLNKSLNKSDKATQTSEETQKRWRAQSFIVPFLFIMILIASFGAIVWLYMERGVLTQTHDKLLLEMQVLLDHSHIAEQKTETLANKNRALIKRTEKLENQHKMLEGKNEMLANQSKKLEAENETLANQNRIVTTQNETLSNKTKILTDQLDKAGRVYRQRISQLRAQNSQLADEIATLLEENARLVNQKETLTNQDKTLTNQNESFGKKEAITHDSAMSGPVSKLVSILESQILALETRHLEAIKATADL